VTTYLRYRIAWYENLSGWRIARQRNDCAALTTINRELASLHDYCLWHTICHLLPEYPAIGVEDVPTDPLASRFLSADAINALLCAVLTKQRVTFRVLYEALLALLIYARLRVQEICYMQVRDLKLGSSSVTGRSGKAGKTGHVPLYPDTHHLLCRYLEVVCCPARLAALGRDQECELRLIGIDTTLTGQSTKPGITQRLAQRTVQQLGQRERNIGRRVYEFVATKRARQDMLQTARRMVVRTHDKGIERHWISEAAMQFCPCVL
jgi:site-specific recombinase XerD